MIISTFPTPAPGVIVSQIDTSLTSASESEGQTRNEGMCGEITTKIVLFSYFIFTSKLG